MKLHDNFLSRSSEALKFKGRGEMTKDSVGGWGKAFINAFWIQMRTAFMA